MSRRSLTFATCLAAFGGCAFVSVVHARAKTDFVFLHNGDRITGEIKHLDRGILQLSTNDIGTINIEWEDVDSLNSVYHFRVEDQSGRKHFGAVFLTRSGTLQTIHDGVVEEMPQTDVVAITPLEASFWQQLDGSISLGLSYTKSNSLAQLTSDIYVRRRTPVRMLELEMSNIATSQEDEAMQRRGDVSLAYSRLFEGPLFATAGAGGQWNDELGLDLRAQLSVGVGADLIQTNHNDLVATAGLSGNREWSDAGDGGYNLEGFLSAEHAVFRYDYPKTDVTSEFTIYPSLTSWGRIRAELDISASREIVSDFTVALSFYDSYDNEPADPTADHNDYGLVMSLGWTF
jgi:hypothetical protein